VSTAPAHAGVLDDIERCESGGNPTAQNPRSTASGAFQFLNSTWRSVTGLPGSAKNYSYATQRAAAEKLLAAQGTTPWNPSRSCWSKGGGTVTRSAPSARQAPRATVPKTKRAVPKTTAPKTARKAAPSQARSNGLKLTAGRAWDGSGVYRCGPETLYFEACDPVNIGELTRYPLYDGLR
jgi:hypothetical protein